MPKKDLLLILEDNDFNAEMLLNRYKKYFEIIIHKNLEDFLKDFHAHRLSNPPLIIDNNVPRYNTSSLPIPNIGYEFLHLELLKNNYQGQVIFNTASEEKEIELDTDIFPKEQYFKVSIKNKFIEIDSILGIQTYYDS